MSLAIFGTSITDAPAGVPASYACNEWALQDQGHRVFHTAVICGRMYKFVFM